MGILGRADLAPVPFLSVFFFGYLGFVGNIAIVDKEYMEICSSVCTCVQCVSIYIYIL